MTSATRKFASLEDELHQAATCKTGLDDFGDQAYRQGLRVLLNALDTDLQLTEHGWRFAYDSWLLGTLTARLYTQKGWAEHPEVLTIPIHRPLVIIGLPRTGTTALHKLLSLDSQFQGIEFWLSDTPMIRPPRETWDTHPAYSACIANIDALYTRVPAFHKVHELVAGEPEECVNILMQNFVNTVWSVFGLPTYSHWAINQNALESYCRFVNVLRLIGAREPHKRWLLKNPFHMAEIATLLEVFPDACIIQTHRDPLQSIPSACSLLRTLGQGLEGDATEIGPRQCAYWRRALDLMQAACRKQSRQFFHVDHRRFRAEPLAIVRSIYEYFSLTLTPHTEQQMRTWVARGPTSKHGEHVYAIDSWGITPAQICDVFADYREQHQFK